MCFFWGAGGSSDWSWGMRNVGESMSYDLSQIAFTKGCMILDHWTIPLSTPREVSTSPPRRPQWNEWRSRLWFVSSCKFHISYYVLWYCKTYWLISWSEEIHHPPIFLGVLITVASYYRGWRHKRTGTNFGGIWVRQLVFPNQNCQPQVWGRMQLVVSRHEQQ